MLLIAAIVSKGYDIENTIAVFLHILPEGLVSDIIWEVYRLGVTNTKYCFVDTCKCLESLPNVKEKEKNKQHKL